ncbi:RidA family protein [Methylophilaceae bacterium]|jgi:reactive intermediate/imine deaminase|nr:RidA family protein [Nitrosomonadales bacterium]MBT6355659.1 RidA family protein [Nitrosomonadales bacterium]MCH9771345.1 RidA family protein [Betaproteobacteria bacterium]MDA9086758.1 RidA family protein [Methylophilaceae bacterium]MDB2679599.1 RidA family protein [Methylophilaceae bacterium]|tara:strand:- start:2917 stop:3294 length:378 start_codon:yes stop_codon:yes gene_type:complete
MKKIIKTENAPAAIGTYSQAVKKGNIVFLSGQIPLDPKSMELVEGIENQIHQVFKNLLSVIEAAEASVNDLVKLNIYLTDLNNFALVNSIMEKYFSEPYPARAAVGVASLPKGAQVEADGFLVLD